MADQQLIIQLQAQMGDVLSQFDAISAAATAMGGNIQQQMTAAANASSSAWSAAVASVQAQGNPIIMNNDVFATVGASVQASGTAATAAMAKASTAVKAVVPPVNALGNAFKVALGVVGIASITQITMKLKQFATEAVTDFTKADAAAKEFQNVLVQRGLTKPEALQTSNLVGGLAGNVGIEPEQIEQGITSLTVKLNGGKNAAAGFNVALDSMRVLGGTFATAVQRVAIAAEGSLKSLRQFGITTNKDVNGNLKTMSQLLKEMAANMRGGLSTYLQTPLGMIDRMKVSLQELKESIGGALINIFAPAAQFTRGFADALVAMMATSNSAVPALNQLAIAGARVAKWFYDAAMNVKMFAISTFIPINAHDRQVKEDTFQQLFNAKQDADNAANAVIENLTTSTPQTDVTDYLKKIDELLAKTTVDTTAAGVAAKKTAAAWEAAFAPL